MTMQTIGHPATQSKLDIDIAQRTEAMARVYVNTHHMRHSDNWTIELPVDPAMSGQDVELAALLRLDMMLERDSALVKSAISARQANN
jgi:hypothetical protein